MDRSGAEENGGWAVTDGGERGRGRRGGRERRGGGRRVSGRELGIRGALERSELAERREEGRGRGNDGDVERSEEL